MEIKSRLPGIIADVAVKEGDTVQPRKILATLEAMKMEQPIPSPIAGTVKSVKVGIGQSVKQGEVLFVIE